jgi:hypothetical protein
MSIGGMSIVHQNRRAEGSSQQFRFSRTAFVPFGSLLTFAVSELVGAAVKPGAGGGQGFVTGLSVIRVKGAPFRRDQGPPNVLGRWHD